MPPSKTDKWAAYEAPAPAAKPDKWAQYAAAPDPESAAPSGPSPAELTTNSINPATGTGYGLYDMIGPAGPAKVPFDKYESAVTNGYNPAPGVAARYRDDLAATLPSRFQRMTEPTPMNPNTTPVDSSWPANRDAAWNAAANAMGVGGNIVKRAARGVAGAAQFPFHAAGTFVGSMSSDPETSARAEDAILAMHPGAQVYDRLVEDRDTRKQDPALANENIVGDALGMYATGKIAEGVVNAPRAAADFAQSAARRLAGTGTGVARDLVRDVSEDNRKINLHNADRVADAQQAWQEKQAKALEDHRSELLRLKQKYAQDSRDATEKARTGTAEDRAAHQSKQLATKQAYDQAVRDQTQKFQTERAKAEQANAEAAQKVAEDNAKAAQKIADSNAQTTAKHQAVTQRIQTANQAAENMLELRRQHEQAYQQATDTHYAKEAAADAQAKAEENQAWSAWRQKTAGKTLDGGQISGPLQKLRLDSPEVDRTLNQLEPRGDEVPQESPYAQIRERTSQQHFGKDYQSLSPVKQDEVDDLLHAGGYTPEPIAFDPQAGQPISIDRVQRASSILQRYIRSGRFEGPLLGEMKQVAGVLRNAVTRASTDAGAATELDSARNATITYQGAFGRELKTPTTARTIREQQVNPEAFQTREDEARLARARRYDPTLVDSYRQVKAAREALDKLPPEDQLRKSLRQVPAPPTVGDTRSGFRLQSEAVPVKYAPKPLPAGANLPLPPIQDPAPAPRAAKLPLPPVLPDPEPVPYRAPKLTPTKTISPEDIRRENEAKIRAGGSGLVRNAMRVATFWGPLKMIGELARTGETSLRPLAAVPAAGAAGMGVEALLEHPGVREFFTRPTRAQLAAIPPELRGQMPEIVEAARSRGVHISPLIAAYAATIQRNRNQSQPIQQQQPATQGATQ